MVGGSKVVLSMAVVVGGWNTVALVGGSLEVVGASLCQCNFGVISRIIPKQTRLH